MLRKRWGSYFIFTKKERKGIFILLFFIVLIYVISYIYPYFQNDDEVIYSNADLEKLKLKVPDSSEGSDTYRRTSYQRKYPGSNISKTEFFFDPNTATPAEWQRLGLQPWTIKTITRYLEKGGKFREPSDLKKIWGIKEEDAERLIPYVRIKELFAKEFEKSERKYIPPVVQPVNINDSDTSGFIALPGIGNKLSSRIIAFRNKLGGFYSVDQVGETFGLPDSTFQKIKPFLILSGEVKKININTATIDEMKSHPYIRYQLANAIVQYRNQNGLYKSIGDINKIMIVDEPLYKKLLPYLHVE